MNTKSLSLVIVLFMLGGLVSYAAETEKEDQLQSLKDELNLKRSEYGKLDEKEQDQLLLLRRLEEQIALSGQLIFKIERSTAQLEIEISDDRIRLDESNLVLERRKGILFNRLRYIYKIGNRLQWSEILLSDNPTGVLTAIKNMKVIMAYDRRLVESYRRLSENIAADIVKFNRQMIYLGNLKMDYQHELMQRKVTLDTRKKLLDRLRKDKSVISESMDRLEEDAQSIAGIFDDLLAEKDQGEEIAELAGLDDRKGDLVWPAYGEIIRPFGTTKDKRGIKLTNPGIDIKAEYGSKVGSAALGKVIYVSWLRGYGQFIIIDHGANYYTLYANLSSVTVDLGDEVMGGQTVGLVGDSGSLQGARLHFELRHGKQQLNPVDWLR